MPTKDALELAGLPSSQELIAFLHEKTDVMGLPNPNAMAKALLLAKDSKAIRKAVEETRAIYSKLEDGQPHVGAARENRFAAIIAVLVTILEEEEKIVQNLHQSHKSSTLREQLGLGRSRT